MNGRLPAFAAALAITALFTVASFPGFMSFDSVEALRQARGSVEGSQYPPFGSYVWRVLDWIWPGPTLMQLAQNGLLLGSFALIIQTLRWPVLLQIAALVWFALVPPFTGTMLVVWKDVAVAAFFLSGFAVLFWAQERSLQHRRGTTLLAISLVFCGMAYRFNAASGAVPIVVYATWLSQEDDVRQLSWIRAIVRGGALTLALFAGVWGINSYRFPTLDRLERNTNMDSIMRFDLVGISAFSGQSSINDAKGNPVEVGYLRRMYDPRHLNITSGNDSEKRLPANISDMTSIWAKAIVRHPGAYLRHRGEVFREYIGLHCHEVFYVTHPSVDKNTLGVEHTPNALTAEAIKYVWQFRGSVIDRPWVYYAVALFAFALMHLTKIVRYRVEAGIILSSGLCYLAPMYFIAPAADLRYNFWSIWAALLCIAFAVSGLLSSSPLHISDKRRSPDEI
jgi:hypothetical protein